MTPVDGEERIGVYERDPSPTAETDGLVVEGLSAGYGRMTVVHDVSLRVPIGGWIGIVGRNGVGKTTTLAAICGLRRGRFSGSVMLGGREITRLSPSKVTACGLVYVPDGHRIFTSLSVTDNLTVAGSQVKNAGSSVRERIDRVINLFPQLKAYLAKQAGLLSGGEQQMLSIGQAMMLRPTVLVLDEPSSALAPLVVNEIYRALEQLRREGVGLLVTEQNVARSLNSVDHCMVMDGGAIRLAGAAADLRADSRVTEVVLGRQ